MNKLTLALIMLIIIGGAYGFSTLSLSRVDFNSNDPTLAKAAWLLTVVEDGNEQYATATFDNEAIKRSDGATAKNDMTINIINTKNTCEYTFQNSYDKIYNVQMLPANYWNTDTQCSQTPGCFRWARSGISAVMFTKTASATVAPLSTPMNAISSAVSVKVNGESVTGIVNNIGQKSVNLGSRVHASWSGNLVSGQQCPAPLDTGVMGIKQGTGFLITSKAAYDNYKPAEADFTGCIAGGIGTLTLNKDALQRCVDQYNGRANAAMVKTTRAPFSTATISSSKAILNMPALLQYPVITLRVDADWLGVFLPVGKPEIQSVTSEPFTEATSGKITATVKNVGAVRASFNIGVQCDDPAARVGASRTLSLDPGQTGTAEISISGQAGDATVTSTCTVSATDINNPDNKDSESVTVTIKPIGLCSPAEQRCIQNTIESCNTAGTKWIQSQVCPYGCKLNDGTYTCAEPVACSKDTDCDDKDSTTLDECVGTLGMNMQCKYSPITAWWQQPWAWITGGIVGGIVLILLVVLIIGVMFRKRR